MVLKENESGVEVRLYDQDVDKELMSSCDALTEEKTILDVLHAVALYPGVGIHVPSSFLIGAFSTVAKFQGRNAGKKVARSLLKTMLQQKYVSLLAKLNKTAEVDIAFWTTLGAKTVGESDEHVLLKGDVAQMLQTLNDFTSLVDAAKEKTEESSYKRLSEDPYAHSLLITVEKAMALEEYADYIHKLTERLVEGDRNGLQITVVRMLCEPTAADRIHWQLLLGAREHKKWNGSEAIFADETANMIKKTNALHEIELKTPRLSKEAVSNAIKAIESHAEEHQVKLPTPLDFMKQMGKRDSDQLHPQRASSILKMVKKITELMAKGSASPLIAREPDQQLLLEDSKTRSAGARKKHFFVKFVCDAQVGEGEKVFLTGNAKELGVWGWKSGNRHYPQAEWNESYIIHPMKYKPESKKWEVIVPFSNPGALKYKYIKAASTHYVWETDQSREEINRIVTITGVSEVTSTDDYPVWQLQQDVNAVSALDAEISKLQKNKKTGAKSFDSSFLLSHFCGPVSEFEHKIYRDILDQMISQWEESQKQLNTPLLLEYHKEEEQQQQKKKHIVKFSCSAHLAADEQLYVIGSAEEIGKWTLNKKSYLLKPLELNKKEMKYEIEVAFENTGVIEYKYFKCTKDAMAWEQDQQNGRSNRVVTITEEGTQAQDEYVSWQGWQPLASL